MFKCYLLVLLGIITALPANATTQFENTKHILIEAGKLSNVDPVELTTIAALESSFKNTVNSKYSSAKGLFQFTNRTWRVTLNSYRDNYKQVQKWDIYNPLHNTLMGAEYIKENNRILQKRLNRDITLLDTYMAHLLAPRRVVYLEKINQNKPLASVYPKLAKYNKPLFYTKSGKPRTIREFKHYLQNKLNNAFEEFGSIVQRELMIAKVKQFRDTILTATDQWWMCASLELVRTLKGNLKHYLPTGKLSIGLMNQTYVYQPQNHPNKPLITNIDLHFYDRRLFSK